jgi:hypothetical protein
VCASGASDNVHASKQVYKCQVREGVCARASASASV